MKSLLFAAIIALAVLAGCQGDNPVAPQASYVKPYHEFKYESWYNPVLKLDSAGYYGMFYGQIFSRDTIPIVGLKPKVSLYHSPGDRDSNQPFDTVTGKIGKIEGLDIMKDLKPTDTLKVGDNLWHLTLTHHFDLPPGSTVFFLFAFSIEEISGTKKVAVYGEFRPMIYNH